MRLWFLSCLLCGHACAQLPATISSGTHRAARAIGPDDVIALTVYDAPELTRSVQVGDDGSLRLPMLQKSLHVDGLSLTELEQRIAAALREEKLLIDPLVTATVAEYHSRPIRVAGAVRKPLTFQASERITLLDALTRAEGLSPEAGPEILLSRGRLGDGAPRQIERIAVRALIHAADPAANPELVGGEEILVPEAGRIYVVGNVRRPGIFPVKETQGTTMLEILAQAEGLAPFATAEGYVYRRAAPSQPPREIAIALRRILDRKSPDMALLPDDIVYIPDNRGRRMTVSALERIAGFGSSTASGVLIWRR
jgi:polysaccharide export outer membrane protein